MTIGILIGSLVLALCEGGEILTTCDLVGLNLCAWKLGQNISKEYDGELSAMPSPEQVALLCRFRPEYKMCYQGKISGCGLNLVYLSTLGTTQSTADFLCGEGNSDLLQHSSCWEKPLVRNTTNQCNKDYATSAQKLLNQNNNHMMTKAETTEWCSIINISSVCMYDTVLDNCDLDAASFVVTMMEKAMAKLTSFLNCYGEESSLPVPDVSTADNTSTITRRSLAMLPSSGGNAQGVPYNGAGGARLSGDFSSRLL
uniref:Uncharacterized protein LOC111121944 n=1 Tax=Crassostrea virginica TaxID=6565 RepID=A0A8B8CTK3_CRAVI|nr:uncharacterized protein LOC111121944 [Crassostrea virginica]